MSFQVRHREWGVFQGTHPARCPQHLEVEFLAMFWYPRSRAECYGYQEFRTEGEAERFISLLCAMFHAVEDMSAALTIEPYATEESLKMRKSPPPEHLMTYLTIPPEFQNRFEWMKRLEGCSN